jgi:outer membrane protein OmpA-like peptidoglycan-associated protein
MTEGPLDKTLSDGTRLEGSVPAESVGAVPAGRHPTASPSEPVLKPERSLRSNWLGSPWAFAGLGAVLVLAACGLVARATHAATGRLQETSEARPQIAIADQAEVAYCTPEFKQVLERVLHACGLEGANSRHGCQPSDVKSFASISDEDFNALFTPLKDRGAVLLFDNNSEELDASAKKLLEERFLDRRGARYFFAVARASKSGNQAKNRALSHRRANSVKFHVAEASADPDLDRKFGQMWLGNEFAQLSTQFCDWPSSRSDQKCSGESINRSVFVSWVDCRL